MELPILIEPIEGGRFRARAGEPFALAVEGDSREEAAKELERLITERLREGAQLATVNVPIGSSSRPAPLPFPADELYQTDWVYRELHEAITENRRQEEEKDRSEGQESASWPWSLPPEAAAIPSRPSPSVCDWRGSGSLRTGLL